MDVLDVYELLIADLARLPLAPNHLKALFFDIVPPAVAAVVLPTGMTLILAVPPFVGAILQSIPFVSKRSILWRAATYWLVALSLIGFWLYRAS